MESDMTLRVKLKGKELKAFCFFSMAMLFVAAMAGMFGRGGGRWPSSGACGLS